MDQDVKKEEEDLQLRTASSVPGEDDFTIAQLSTLQTPTPDPFSTGLGKRNRKPTEKKVKLLKMKKSVSETRIKHAAYDEAGKCISCKKSKGAGKCTPTEVKSPVMIRAEELQSNLEPAFPSFAKCMVRSHVGSCFWMGLPGPFCKAHLPNEDTTVTLEDEYGKQFDMKYIAYKTGLSAGWRQFSVAHNLLEGDVLVFQLIRHKTFKVYVIRAHDLSELDGALGLLNLDAHTKQIDAEMGTVSRKSIKRKRKSLPLAIGRKVNKKSGRPRSAHNNGQLTEQSENDSEEVGSEVLEGFKLSTPAVVFEDIKSLEDFNISVCGLVIDSELPEDIRNKYYNLCCSQNAFLHENLIQGINFKLIVGTISEVVNIADAISACKLITSRNEFASWGRSLKAFELLGMNVGFLRARLSRLVSLAFESEGASYTRRYVEAKTARTRAEEKIRNLEAKVAELKEAGKRFGAEIESLKSKAEIYELKFQEEVTAPW
ncbi:B3 domain-containing protein/DUF724 domain-containing protein [Cephalotus follicularis]|uniref:B3 domain-containing protein/DUF724 domain-containing protein n=1 Tax=Cephalotus follicularis TaxID=3775 RepID=A0A1Q3D1S5_CEPFO|nr:B3 domain-containing protein/DUF724 domain-containing protein [Cephalotus follicularis]